MEKSRFPAFTVRFRELVGNRSATDFAKEVGISRQTVSFYLNGDRIPDAETLAQICSSSGVSADWLLGLTGTRSRESGIQAACDYTGISEESAEYLHDRKDPADACSADLTDPAILSAILAHANACDMMGCIRYAAALRARHDGQPQDLEAYRAAKEAGYIPLLADESAAYYEMRAADLFRQIVSAVAAEKASSTTTRISDLLDLREVILDFSAQPMKGAANNGND